MFRHCALSCFTFTASQNRSARSTSRDSFVAARGEPSASVVQGDEVLPGEAEARGEVRAGEVLARVDAVSEPRPPLPLGGSPGPRGAQRPPNGLVSAPYGSELYV